MYYMDVASVTSASSKAPIQTIPYVFKRNNNYLNCHQTSKLEVQTGICGRKNYLLCVFQENFSFTVHQHKWSLQQVAFRMTRAQSERSIKWRHHNKQHCSVLSWALEDSTWGHEELLPPQMKMLFPLIESRKASLCPLIFRIINWLSLHPKIKMTESH